MSDSGCFVDTTVMTEALIKTRSARSYARDQINQYVKSVLPIYAIKEFKAGPLRAYCWVHNKLVDTRSFPATMQAVHRQYPSHFKGTAEEALIVGAEMLVGSDLSQAGTRMKTHVEMADSARYTLRRRIEKAWDERRRITTEVFEPLSCFAEASPFYDGETNRIENLRRKCDLASECCLAPHFRKRRGDIKKLISAIARSTRKEDRGRRKALYKLLERKPAKQFGDEDCRNLGDAYFALQCPDYLEILTTNFEDHRKLGGALRKGVRKMPIVKDYVP